MTGAWDGVDSGKPAGAVQITRFDGPRDAAVVEAMRRANRERVSVAALAVPGAIAAWELWHAGTGSMVVVSTATSLDSLAAAQHAILSTELLPGEDPALLIGPDRVDLHTVVSHS